MKLIIAGGRNYIFDFDDIKRLNAFNDGYGVDEVVSGCAAGADTCGEMWARAIACIPVKRFPADWKTHGRSAGYIRNTEMAKYADAVALFPGGSGTNHMYKIAKTNGLIIRDWRKL